MRRFVLGAEVEGVFTLFALLFFLIGVMLFGLGLLGEYVGRIYQEVRRGRATASARCSSSAEQEPRDAGEGGA